MERLSKAIFAALLMSVASAALAQNNSYTVPRAKGEIVIDGRLDEPDWKAAPLIGEFKAWKSAAEVPGTRAWIVQEKEHLVLAMECMEEFPQAIRCTHGHDGDVWRDDHIELFLDSEGERKRCVQIVVNAKGTIADAFYKDAQTSTEGDWSWESEAEAKTVIGQDRWCLEMRLPFAVLPPFVPGHDWTFHIVRSRYTLNTLHLTSLQGRLTSFHDIFKFDTLSGIAGNSSGIQTVEQSFGDITEGDTRSWITVKNTMSDKQVAVRISLEVTDGKAVLASCEQTGQVEAGASQRFDLVWPCRQAFLGSSIAMRLEVDGRRIQSFTRPIRSILPMIGDFRTNIGQLGGTSPAVFAYSLHLCDYGKPMMALWELWTEDGAACLLQGRAAVRGEAQRIRVFTSGMRPGLYRIRRFLVDEPSGTMLKGREDTVMLTSSPWQD